MARSWIAGAILGGALALPAGLAAQTVFLQMPAACAVWPCLDRQLAIAAAPIRVTGERPAAPGAPATYVTPDGRFGVGMSDAGTGSAAVVVSDLVAGTWFAVAMPGLGGLVGNPQRAEVYGADAASVVAISAAGIRRLAARDCGPVGPTSGVISPDGRRTAFGCPSQSVVQVYDTVTGAVVGTVASAIAGIVPDVVAFAPDGESVYDVSLNPKMLRRIALATGTPVSQIAVDPAATTVRVAVDPRTGRVVLSEGEFRAVRVLEADLTFRQFAPYLPLVTWSFDPQRPRAMAFSTQHIEGGVTVFAGLSAVDTDLWTLAESVSAWLPCCGAITTATAWPPGAPSSLATTVAGSSVSLSWNAPTPANGVMRHVLEAGSASGLTNIATFDVGLQTSLAVGGVPPGTYYVRVRAVNYVGSSLASNEVVVSVP